MGVGTGFRFPLCTSSAWINEWYLAEEGGLLFDDVGPFRNFGDIGDNERSEGQRKGNRRTLWANGNSPAQKHRKSQALRWKEDGGAGLGTRPSTDCSPSGPAGPDCLARYGQGVLG